MLFVPGPNGRQKAIPIAHRPTWRVAVVCLGSDMPCGGSYKLPIGQCWTGVGHLAEADIDPVSQQDGQELAVIDQGLPSRKFTDPVKSCCCFTEETVAMSETLEDGIKRWSAKRKSALVVENQLIRPCLFSGPLGYRLAQHKDH